MAPAQTKGHEGDKHTGMKENNKKTKKTKKRKKKSRKLGTKKASKKIVLTEFP